jgi:hypothetical protein
LKTCRGALPSQGKRSQNNKAVPENIFSITVEGKIYLLVLAERLSNYIVKNSNTTTSI